MNLVTEKKTHLFFFFHHNTQYPHTTLLSYTDTKTPSLYTLSTHDKSKKSHSDLFARLAIVPEEKKKLPQKTHEKTVSHLPKVRRPLGVKVDFGVNLVHPRQGVHDNRRLLGLLQYIIVDDIDVLDSFVLRNVFKSFLLYSSNVQDVRFGHNLISESEGLGESDAGSGSLDLDRLGHGKRTRGDKVEGNVVKGEKLDK